MMSELKAPVRRSHAAAAVGIDDSGEDLNGHQLGALGDARSLEAVERIVPHGDSGHVRSVKAVGHRARRRGAGAELLIESAGTQRFARARHRARIAGFIDELACEERMAGVDSGVEHGDDGAAAVVSARPYRVGFDERHALGERGASGSRRA